MTHAAEPALSDFAAVIEARAAERSVDVLAELPRNPIGKALKKDLRKRYRAARSG